MIALDASALLAYLFTERGHEHVTAVIDDSCLSSVNLCEVIGRFVRDGHDAQRVLRRLSATAIEFVPFSPEEAALAASLLPQTRRLGLSLGDRACLALAIFRGIPAMTTESSWQDLSLPVSVRVIR